MCYYVSITECLQKAVQNDHGLIKELKLHKETAERASVRGVTCSVLNGSVAKRIPRLQESPHNTFALILFGDELEVANVLGSHHQKFFVGAYAIANASPERLYPVDHLRIFMIAPADALKTSSGCEKLLEPVVNELNKCARGIYNYSLFC